MQKINGKMAIDQMSERLRRYSRSSLRTMARTRRALMLIGGLHVLVDQLEVDVLQRVARLADRQHVGSGGHAAPG